MITKAFPCPSTSFAQIYLSDSKERVPSLIRDGLNELFSQIDELAAQIDEKIAGKSGGLGF